MITYESQGRKFIFGTILALQLFSEIWWGELIKLSVSVKAVAGVLVG